MTETAIVVSSKSGSTLETDSQRRVFEQAFTEAGIDAAEPDHRRHRSRLAAGQGVPRRRLPGGLQRRPERRRALLRADRFRAGPVAGWPASTSRRCLDEAEEAAEVLNEDAADNIGLALGAALGGTDPLRNKMVIAEDGSGIVGLRATGPSS